MAAAEWNQRLEDCLFVQRGVISRAQALECGMSEGQLRRKLDAREWRVMRDGVYRVGLPDGLHAERVLVEVLRTGGTASHRCAAHLLGMDRVDPFEGVELITQATFPPEPGLRFARISDPYFEVAHVERGIPVTTIPWTLAMLGAVAPSEEVEWAVDWAVRRGFETWHSLDAFVRRNSRQGRRGFGVLRKVLDLRGPSFVATESLLETLYLQLLRRSRLPAAVQQFPIHDRGRVALRADFAWPEHKVIVETLGKRWHDPSTRKFDDDRARVNQIKRLMRGWTVLEFTWNHVRHKQTWVATVTAEFLGLKPVSRRNAGAAGCQVRP